MGQNSNRDNQSGSPVGTLDSVRLDSWKEIASYLHRDARTVRRWERERRLPVHRVPGGERSGVFAYVDELDRWLRASDTVSSESFGGPSEVEADIEESLPVTADRDLVESPLTPTAASANLSNPETVGLGSTAEAHQQLVSAVSHQALANALPVQESGVTPNPPPAKPWIERRQPIPAVRTSRRALYGMAFLLVATVAAGSTFAVMHYQRFHLPDRQASVSSPEAQDLYLRGRYFWNLRTESGLNQALDLFTQSIVHDPHYAPAYAGLADSYLLLRQYGHMPDSEAYPRALAAARQAVVLDPSSPDAHRSIAFILRFWNWDMVAAEKEYLRAIELDPRNSQSHHWYATALLSAGRIQEALAQIDLARALEPQSVSVLADRGLILSFEDPERGAEALRQVEQNQPEFASAHSYLSRIYLNQGDYASFLSEARISAKLLNEPDKVAILDQARRDLEARGPVSMLRNLASSYAPLAESGRVSAYSVAEIFGVAGDSVHAIQYLKMACDRRDPGFLGFQSDPAFSQVRSTPGYLALLARKDAQPIARLDRPNPI